MEETNIVQVTNLNDCVLRKNVNGTISVISPLTGEIVKTSNAASSYILEEEVRHYLLDQIRIGKTFLQISKQLGMPGIEVIYYWRKIDPTFKKQITQARKDRALYFQERAIEAAEEFEDCVNKDAVTRTKAKFEAFMRLAEIDSPQEYTPKAQLATVGPVMATTIIINTGIDRTPIEDGVVDMSVSQFKTIGEVDEEHSRNEASSPTKDDVIVFTTEGTTDFEF